MVDVLVTLRRRQRSLLDYASSMAVVTGGVALARLFGLVTSVFVARVAGAETFGEFSLFITVFVVVSEVGSALNTVFLRSAGSPDQKGRAGHHYAVNVLARFLYAAVLGGLGWVVAPVIAGSVFDKPDAAGILRVAVVAGALVSLFVCVVGLYQQRKQHLMVAVLLVVFNFMVMCCVLILGLLRVELTQDIVGYVYLVAAGALAVIPALGLGAHFTTVGRHLLRELKVFYGVGMLLIFSAAINIARLDVLFLASHVDFGTLGEYGAAVRTTVVFAILNTAFLTILVPKAATAVHERTEFRSYLQAAGGYAVASTVAAALTLVFLEPIVLLLFGEMFVGIRDITAVLILYTLVTGYTIPFQTLVQVGKRPRNMLLLSTVRLTVTAVLLSLLIPRWGVFGAAYAMLAASVIMLVAFGVVAARAAPR